MQMQEYVKDFANRIGGRNRGKWRHEDKKGKNAAAGLYQTDPGRTVPGGTAGTCGRAVSGNRADTAVWDHTGKRGYVYGASGGAAASYEAAALPKEQNDPKLSLHAQSAVLMDGLTGRILYGKNENDIRPMASTTKIMTCILALEAGGLDEFAEASSNAAAQPQVRLGVKKGERYQIRDLL
ncbi:MAG: hypothetical protein ACLUEJ_10130 [Clostridium sp.]